jgi:excisionase family DNA binding protein
MGGTDRLQYGVEESAELLSLSVKEVRRAIGRGDLAAVRYGRRLLIPAEALRDFVESLPKAAQ